MESYTLHRHTSAPRHRFTVIHLPRGTVHGIPSALLHVQTPYVTLIAK